MKLLALIIPAFALIACQPLTPACNPLARIEIPITGPGPRNTSAALAQALIAHPMPGLDPIAPAPLLGGGIPSTVCSAPPANPLIQSR